jgi:DNA-binding NarL/FixJ family response regulator
VIKERSASSHTISEHGASRNLLILSEVRLLREGIAGVIEGHSGLSVGGLCELLSQVLSAVRERPGATVLLDASFPNGPEALRKIRSADALGCVVVFAVSETEENVVAWARAGAAGYIPTTAGSNELVRFIESINRGEQICSAAIASKLMRRLGSSSSGLSDDRHSRLSDDRHFETLLTTREHEIIRLIAAGLSNKEIARELHIELSTTKTHVHNLLGKLGVQRRGQMAYWAHKLARERL